MDSDLNISLGFCPGSVGNGCLAVTLDLTPGPSKSISRSDAGGLRTTSWNVWMSWSSVCWSSGKAPWNRESTTILAPTSRSSIYKDNVGRRMNFDLGVSWWPTMRHNFIVKIKAYASTDKDWKRKETCRFGLSEARSRRTQVEWSGRTRFIKVYDTLRVALPQKSIQRLLRGKYSKCLPIWIMLWDIYE